MVAWRRQVAVGVLDRPLSAAREEVDDGRLDVDVRRRVHQEVSERLVVDGNDRLPVDPVMVQKPPCQQEGCAFVALPEGLCACNTKGQLAGGSHRVDFVANGIYRSCETFEVIGLLEPLIAFPDGLVDPDCELDRGQPQWSRR